MVPKIKDVSSNNLKLASLDLLLPWMTAVEVGQEEAEWTGYIGTGRPT